MKKTNSKTSLINFLDNIFMVDGEMISNNGEDSYLFSVNDHYGIVGVFDGCGGIGSRKYAEYNNKTGAYISSKVVSNVVANWFDKFCNSNVGISGNTITAICDELKDGIVKELKNYEKNATASGIKGSLTKSFPTTASMILFDNKDDKIYSAYIWAGDSRGFVLTDSGLTQITKDDIEDDYDALDNISNDSKLTNVVSAIGDFVLHSKIITCEKNGILITATDGCFGYFSTPMEFEYMLLDTMQKSASADEWQLNINKYIRKYTSDDYTIGLVSFGYKGFKKMKRIYMPRYKFLLNNYIRKLDVTDEVTKNHLWNEYKKNYYRGV